MLVTVFICLSSSSTVRGLPEVRYFVLCFRALKNILRDNEVYFELEIVNFNAA